MFSSPGDYQKPSPWRVPSRFLRYLNIGILAFAITIAIALLVTMRSKGSEANKSSSCKVAKNEIIADNYRDASHTLRGEVVQKKPAVPEAPQFIRSVISAFNGAFDDRSLIDYAREQGTDIPDSTTPSTIEANHPFLQGHRPDRPDPH